MSDEERDGPEKEGGSEIDDDALPEPTDDEGDDDTSEDDEVPDISDDQDDDG